MGLPRALLLPCLASPQILSFNEISSLDGLAGLTHLRHLDLGYNIIEGVQCYPGSAAPQAADPDRANGDGSSATQDDSGSAIIACERTTGPSDQEQDRSLVVSEAAAVADRGGGGGERDWEGEERDRKRRSSAAGEIALPCLTRLDLNNNILHNLDDLKARTEGDQYGIYSL